MGLVDYLKHLFILEAHPDNLLSGEYSPGLVLLSVAVAIFSSTVALQLVDLVKSGKMEGIFSQLAVAAAGVALGTGVWSMHFIGMLSFNLCVSVDYDPWITLISGVPSILASWAAMRTIVRDQLSLRQMVVGGVLVGAGIGSMHYIGMGAMDMGPQLRYDPRWFVLSIVVAVVLAIVALSIRFHVRRWFPALREVWVLLASGAVMGAAIAGMHYTGMTAARFVGVMDTAHDASQQDTTGLALMVAAASVVIVLLAVAVNGLLRYSQLLRYKSASEARLEAILATAVDGIVTINNRGIIEGCNAAAERILGWRAPEIIGRNVNVLMPEPYHSQHDGYLRQYQNTGEARIIGTGREVLARHKDGHTIPIRLGVGEAQLPGDEQLYVGFLADISEQRAMEEALRNSEQQYSSLISNMPGVVFRCLLDEHWSMLFISDSVEYLTGWPAASFTGRETSFAELILPEDSAMATQAVEDALARGSQYSVEYRIRHREGHIVWVLDKGSFAYSEAEEPEWIDGVLLDISERREMEEALREAKRRAEAAAETKANFLANMSHEIRTPMNAIIGFSDVLNETDLNSKQQSYLSSISTSARSLLHLINDILDSAKLDKGKLEIEIQDFNLIEVLDNAVSTLWLQARNKKLDLQLAVDPALGTFYKGAPERIRQILTNLLGNAIKFTEHGRVTVTVAPAASGEIEFSVADTGIGIAEDRLTQIFEPFVQADASMSRVYGGTGLGTSISKQLVELMGGKIWATSVLNEGSCFTFTLPLPPGSATPITASVADIELPPQRILVVDDLEQNVEVLTLLLRRAGHHVISGADGFDAIRQFLQEPLDLILMDVQMPGKDGLSAAREIRQLEAEQGRQRTPIIAFTASVLLEDRRAAEAAGMDGFASKPVDMPVLTAEMARVLGFAASSISLPAPAANAAHEPIQWQQGLALWGEKSRYMRELQRYAEEAKGLLPRLDALSKDALYSELKSRAHGQKGVAGNLSLGPMARAFADLEAAADRAEQGLVVATLKEIQAELARLRLALPQSTSNTTAPTLNGAAGQESFAQCLATLLGLAEQAELNEQVLETFAREAPAACAEEVAKIISAFDEFNFTAACEQLQALQNTVNAGEVINADE